MEKINWFKRLFMSWKDLERYFSSSADSPQTIEQVKQLYEQRIQELRDDKETLQISKSELEKSIIELRQTNIHKDETISDEKSRVINLEKTLGELKTRLDERDRENELIKSDIREQLKTIGKIEKTFFASTGNKGKGELGERQVKTILEKMGLNKEMWITNLSVGTKTVEFAMQSGEEGKFIPIDSKVLDPLFDSENKAIINDDFRNKVRKAAKEVAQYLGKVNTSDYGILVLQSDEIYMSLFEEYPTFFQEMIDDLKIYIQSPSSFVQTAWSISNIVKIYRQVHKDEKIYDDIVDALETVSKFGKKLAVTHNDFNIVMKHFGTIENKHSRLVKRLEKEGKIDMIPKIEFKGDE